MKTKIGVFLGGLVLVIGLPFIASADGGALCISQVQITNGTGKTTEDFIELFNPGSQPFNLNGYRLVKRTASGTADTLLKSWTTDEFIPAYSFYLWANAGFESIASSPNATTSATIADNNGIAIRFGANDTGTLIDSVAWGSTSNSFNNISSANPGAGEAVTRQDVFASSSAFAIALSNPRNSLVSLPPSVSPPIFTDNSSTFSTPDASATATPENYSALVKIYRFLSNPAGEDSGNEWVEIKNLDSESVLLDGWLLDDRDTGSGPAADALVLSGSIAPDEIIRFSLPIEVFSLNNSGGDELNLYFPDSSLAEKVVYAATAYDDGIFELRDGVWQPPTQSAPSSSVNTGSSSGGAGVSPSPAPVNAPTINFLLNEIFTNPPGDDVGREWVEIYNPTLATSSLENYFLADGESTNWSNSAWLIPKGFDVPPLGVLSVILPKNALSLNNSGKEKVKLFSPQKQLLDSISYEDAPENQSWAKDALGKWQWSLPTFGKPNSQTPEPLKIIISEIVPKPFEDGEEFIELFNLATTTVDLENAVLQIGTHKKVFEKGAELSPQGFLAIGEDDLPARLSNSGQSIKFYDSFGRLVAQVVYTKAQTGQAYASDDGKTYVWTGSATPNKANEYVLGETISVKAADNKSAPPSSGAVTKAEAKQILQSSEDLKQQVAVLQESLNQLQTKLDSQNQAPVGQIAPKEIPASAKAPMARLIVWPAAFAALGSAVYVTFKKNRK